MSADELTEDERTRRLLCEALGCVYFGAGPLETIALLDALEDRGIGLTRRTQ